MPKTGDLDHINLYEPMADALRSLCNSVKKDISIFSTLSCILQSYNVNNQKGLGVCYQLISWYFVKDRMSFVQDCHSTKYQTSCHIGNIHRFHKTSKTTKHPIRFKGWKGGR